MKKEKEVENVQLINYQGSPQFAVIPCDEFLVLQKTLDERKITMALSSEAFKKVCGAFTTLQQSVSELNGVWET